MASTTSRETILGDITRALKDGSGSPPSGAARSIDRAGGAAQIRNRCESNRQNLVEQFESELLRIGARVHHAAASEAAVDHIQEIALNRGARTIIAWNIRDIEAIGLRNSLEPAGIKYVTETTDEDFLRIATEASIGVSGADYALADTGTLVLLSGEGQARSVSLLPPVHVAIVRPDQIVSGLDDFFGLLRHEANGAGLSSAVTFITGPSRTADIELTLVIGVHGPQELHVILLNR